MSNKIIKKAQKIVDSDLDKAEKEILKRWEKLHSKKSKLKSLFSKLKK